MKTLLISIFALAFAAGCKDKNDTGDTGTGGGGDTDTDDTNVPGDTVDSCDWSDLGLCYEFTNYADTSTWCDEMATEYGITTNYFAEGCPSGSVGVCDLPAGGDLPVAASAYYYSPEFDETSADESCTEANGTPQ